MQNMSRYKLLDEGAMINLARTIQRWQQFPAGPDKAPIQDQRLGRAARDKMTRHNLRLVVKVWSGNFRSLIPANNAGYPDALQNAATALLRASEKYDPTTGRRFSTYAASWIRKGFLDYLANESRVIRIPKGYQYLIFAAKRVIKQASAEGRPAPTGEELVRELRTTRRNVPGPAFFMQLLDSFDRTNAQSFSDLIGEDGSCVGDLVASKVDDAEADDFRAQAVAAMAQLSDIERLILEKRFQPRGGVGRRKIAKVLSIPEAEVARIEVSACNQLRMMVAH